MAPLRRLVVLTAAASIRSRASAFAPPSSASIVPASTRSSVSSSRPVGATRLRESDSDDDGACWNPSLRKNLAALSSLGLLETSYLTYDKWTYSSSSSGGLVNALCSAGDGAASCGDVLRGPYASLSLGGADVPLSLLGAGAYAAVLLLAVTPLLSSERDESEAVLDGNNRVALLGATTLMASFSAYLVSLLVGVIHASCAFCFFSAGISVGMAALAWTGGALPEGGEESVELRKNGVLAGASSVGVATVAALALFLSVDGDVNNNYAASAASSGTLLASTAPTPVIRPENVPPRITTRSSPAALSLAADLGSLDARMFGAFWCSHCYDQKQTLGAEAMRSIPYIECDAEGVNNQRGMCREREVPGYPTWEIGGKLFPGERSLEELREIVDDVKAGR